MKTTHTQGDWQSSKYSNGDYGIYSDVSNGKDILLVRDYGNEAETEANVRLLVSAPELLHNVKELLALLAFHGYKHSTEISEAERLVYRIETTY